MHRLHTKRRLIFFCLDLFKEFDLDRLAALTQPTKISQKYVDERSK
jgi:hypothetical protein